MVPRTARQMLRAETGEGNRLVQTQTCGSGRMGSAVKGHSEAYVVPILEHVRDVAIAEQALDHGKGVCHAIRIVARDRAHTQSFRHTFSLLCFPAAPWLHRSLRCPSLSRSRVRVRAGRWLPFGGVRQCVLRAKTTR